MKRALESLGYSLPIEVHRMEHETAETERLHTYHIKPQQWIEYWMNENPKLLGGAKGEPATNFEAFWKIFQLHHPSHEVYQKHGHRLGQVVPLLIHGDEGRAVKRTNYLVLSLETPFGSLTQH